MISHLNAIDVNAYQGQVTLNGSIATDEVDKLLKTVRGIPGIHKVVNQLEGYDQTDTPRDVPETTGIALKAGLQVYEEARHPAEEAKQQRTCSAIFPPHRSPSSTTASM